MADLLEGRVRVVAPNKEAAVDEAMEEFRIEPARRFRLIAEPVS
jgi:hypothetical protein